MKVSVQDGGPIVSLSRISDFKLITTFLLSLTYVHTVEAYLFVLDAAPLLLAVGVWVVMWPSLLLEKIFEARYSTRGIYSLHKTSSRSQRAGSA